MTRLRSYLGGRWVEGTGPAETLVNPATEEPLAAVAAGRARPWRRPSPSRAQRGGPALRAMTFAERGALRQGDGRRPLRPTATSCSTSRSPAAATPAATPSSTSTAPSSRSPPTPTLGAALGDDQGARRRRGGPARAHAALPRPARVGAAPRRGGPHQRLQLPGLGPRREGRVRAARRHAGGQQARDQLRPRRPPDHGAPGRREEPARRRAPAARGWRRRPPRAPRPAGRRGLHRLDGDRDQDPLAGPGDPPLRARQRRGRQPQRGRARPRRRARATRPTTSS